MRRLAVAVRSLLLSAISRLKGFSDARISLKFTGVLLAVLIPFSLILFTTSLRAVQDVTAPVLQSFSFTPTAIDTDSGAQTVTATLHVTDDLSGVEGISVIITSPSGKRIVASDNTFYGNDAVVQISVLFGQYGEAGNWHASVGVTDAVGNIASYSQSDLASLGFSNTLSVTSSIQRLIVNTVSDSSTSGDGFCSLREAINNANNPGVDTTGGDCSVGDGTVIIKFNVSGTITLGGTLPAIANSSPGSLTIDGSGQNITVDGANTYQLLVVDSGATLNLNGLR